MNAANPHPSRHYASLCALAREAAAVGSIGNLLAWDQETMMPPGGAALRAEQLGALSALSHAQWTSPRMGDLMGECESDVASCVGADPSHDEEGVRANLREWRRDYDRAKRLPTDLVSELARAGSEAMEAWKTARAKNDFPSFAPHLEKMFALNKRKAECYGLPTPAAAAGNSDPSPEPLTLYDALVEDYEPGMTAHRIERAFVPLRAALAPLIAEIASVAPDKRPSNAINKVPVPTPTQVEFNKFVAAATGFEFASGRLDISAHPFSDGVGPGDTRMTTRYRTTDLMDALSSTLHETGHSLYEQGMPKAARFGQPLAQACSLGIHESQSRMWENFVGRSPAFWRWCMPEAQRMIPGLFDAFSPEDAHRASNIVEPKFIRVDSDEATYNLHIMLRFDLERALLGGDLSVKDLPAAWNERMKKDLGLVVTEDRLGCLQDVHWSGGAIGYFPTYTLGNLYAAQFWETINTDIPDLSALIERGGGLGAARNPGFEALLAWLREKIHTHGRRHAAPELCRRVTGKPLSHEPLMRHLEGKLRGVYGLK